MPLCYLLAAALAGLVFFYGCLELHYFLRLCVTAILARFCKKTVHILDETQVKGICLTNDVDTYKWHMNNARFIRELDFARLDLYERTGLFKVTRQKGGSPVMGACTIRYRKFIKLFSLFIIKSKVVYWDHQSVFIEHRFVSTKDDFVCAIAISNIRLWNCNADEVMRTLFEKFENAYTKPEMPLDVAKWLESNQISSVKLRGSSQKV